jgi:thiamine-phosphate pyrophosphorylase
MAAGIAQQSGSVSFSKYSFVNASSSSSPSPLENAELYGIVDLDYHLSAETASVAAERLLEGGVDVLQLRAGGVPKSIVAGLAEEIHAMTSPLGVPFILHDCPELLRDVPCEGVHLANEGPSVAEVRASAGRPIIVGRDADSVAQARAAAEDGADYIAFGPLFANPKRPHMEAIGLQDVAAVHEALAIPVFCFGGITMQNLTQVCAAGARRVLMVSGWLEAKDIPAAVRNARRVLLDS